ncbi:MAG: D-alanyl-D-alanine carboxypeptidase [Treponema sp.]|uniref:D-alanyl-D-alanine carboxypeptidase family protein n=1 Tax=Treponema sp. TaxID=166 RepID=UPI0025E8274E|nr:D-alanyl-D-alanine carboxypeptidase family protein [Treponema sp.]MBQ9281920.1 D-alanyl-D-alanine carboxypeptidase [Treponema sp.]
MEFYDITDEFIDERTKRAKKSDSDKSKKTSKVKYISDIDFVKREKKPRKTLVISGRVLESKNPIKVFMRMSPFGKKFVLAALGLLVLAILLCAFFAYSASFTKTDRVRDISSEKFLELTALLDELYPEQRVSILKKLPYAVSKAKLDVWAGAAILIDASNGCVLFEKNADEIIPPASIAKLFVMYIVFKDAEAGKVSLDDVVPLPERSWAINMPRDASLMFLGQGQIVTLRELLKGLAVASGNDAALAVADYISGSTKAFVERMNEECAALGLSHTHFVEPSGYDEHNVTTARELAAFCCEYIKRFPQGVEEFHSAPSIKYPLEKNLPPWQKAKGDSTAIYQKNTNPLLGVMEGCDGIKTGFIYESRYNLALTAKRNGVRFISVTMMGSGVGSKQGNAGRVHDGTEMMEWAFSSFADFTPEESLPDSYTVPSLASKSTNGKFVKLLPAWKNTITVPHIQGETALIDAQSVKATVNIPKFIYGEVKAGESYGQIQYKLGDAVLETVPLVADRNYEQAGIFGRAIDSLVSWRF